MKKMLEKPKKGLGILKIRVRELFTHGEGISAPHARHKGRQPLIECAKHDFKIMYFPFLCLLFFWDRQGCCPCSYVSSGAMRNSYLRSSLSLKVCVLHWFYVFWMIDFNCEGVRPWNDVLNFEKWGESLRSWTLKRSFDFWKEKRVVNVGSSGLGIIKKGGWINYERVLTN